MPKKKLLVNIRCRRTFTFDQTVEMTKDEYNQLKDLNGDDVSSLTEQQQFLLLDDYIDAAEILDADDEFEDVQVEISEED